MTIPTACGLLIETGKMLDAWIQKVEAVPYKNDGRECD